MAMTHASRPVQKTWAFCPRCGAPVAPKGRNPLRCGGCGYTHYFSPCTAVGAIIADREGRILLLIRAKDPGKGKYGLPGGFVDPGETAEQALRREVLEETQLKISDCRYLASFPNEYDFGGAILPVTDLFFVVTVVSFEGLAVQDGEIDGWHFCHPAHRELRKMAFDSNRQALKLFLADLNGD